MSNDNRPCYRKNGAGDVGSQIAILHYIAESKSEEVNINSQSLRINFDFYSQETIFVANKRKQAMWIYERYDWMNFKWDKDKISALAEKVSARIGFLHGRIASLAENERAGASVEILTQDIISSFSIEGISLNTDDVRSSIVRRLGVTNIPTTGTSTHYMEGVVDMMLDATGNCNVPVDRERLFGWHCALFPNGRSGAYPITVGSYRKGDVQVISGSMGHERVHYMAPPASDVNDLMEEFMYWFNQETGISHIIRSAIAHLIFVSIHPFDDGNGRIGRAIADMALAAIEGGNGHFFSMSREIEKEKKEYYAILEKTQRFCYDGDISSWLEWYVACLGRAVDSSLETLSSILNKSVFWREHSDVPLSDRQRKVLNIFLDGKEAKLTAQNWSRFGAVSLDSALRDIADLEKKGIVSAYPGKIRKVEYAINYVKTDTFLLHFKNIHIEPGERGHYLSALYDGNKVQERISELDYEQYELGRMSSSDLVHKYMVYLSMS
ncbi:MAG: Fic family protein [Bacteroidales bacterium]|nr:Fic family protein [Bacteroidales bacterium]